MHSNGRGGCATSTPGRRYGQPPASAWGPRPAWVRSPLRSVCLSSRLFVSVRRPLVGFLPGGSSAFSGLPGHWPTLGSSQWGGRERGSCGATFLARPILGFHSSWSSGFSQRGIPRHPSSSASSACPSTSCSCRSLWLLRIRTPCWPRPGPTCASSLLGRLPGLEQRIQVGWLAFAPKVDTWGR